MSEALALFDRTKLLPLVEDGVGGTLACEWSNAWWTTEVKPAEGLCRKALPVSSCGFVLSRSLDAISSSPFPEMGAARDACGPDAIAEGSSCCGGLSVDMESSPASPLGLSFFVRSGDPTDEVESCGGELS